MTKVDILTDQKNTIPMKTTLIKNTDQILFSIIVINQIFFFHSYNMLNTNLIYIMFSMCVVAAITITLRNIYLYKNLKKKDLIFIFILLLAALIEGITTFLNYEQIGLAFYSYSDTIFIYTSSFFLLATIFFYINLRIISYDNFLNIVRIASIVSAILLLTSLIDYQYIRSVSKHAGMFNPLIYLFFWDDNLSAKTQHAFILFLINFFLIQNIYNKYNNKDFILTVLNSTLIFLIFSKIFIVISVAVYFCFLVFVFTRKNFIITCATLLSMIILLAFHSYTVHKFTDNKFSYTNNLFLKFGFFIDYVYPEKFENQLLKIKQVHLTSNLSHLTSTEDIRDYFDSASSRIEITKECLARENNKNFSSIQIRKKTRYEMKKNYIQDL